MAMVWCVPSIPHAYLCSRWAGPLDFRVSSCIKIRSSAKEDTHVEAEKPGARARRLDRVRYEKQRRLEREAATYPEWATILEEQTKNDEELAAILGDSIGNPKEMQRKIKERLLRKGDDILSPKSGSAVPVAVLFRDFDPFDSHIWFELYQEPSEKDMDIIGNVIRSWYMLGRLGAFNTLNTQLTDAPVDAPLRYDLERAAEALPAYFHNIGDLEFQDSWGRIWVDLGTSDPLALDVFINAISFVSSDHVGIKQVIFGGQRFGDWEEGMTNPDDGYKVYKI